MRLVADVAEESNAVKSKEVVRLASTCKMMYAVWLAQRWMQLKPKVAYLAKDDPSLMQNAARISSEDTIGLEKTDSDFDKEALGKILAINQDLTSLEKRVNEVAEEKGLALAAGILYWIVESAKSR